MASKIQLAHERAARLAKLTGGSLLVGLSGKDSFVTLDIAAEHFDRIVCFHMYYVRGLRCLEAPLETMAKRAGAELIFVPHFGLCRMMKNAVLRPHLTKVARMPTMKKGDSERLARVRSGIDWIAYGERLSDSFARRLFWRKLDGIYPEGKRATIIFDWLDRDVIGYLKAKHLPTPWAFYSGRVTGFELTPRVLGHLRATHPDDYARVLRVFPAAGVQLIEPEDPATADRASAATR